MSVKPQARFIIFQNLFDSIKIIALPHTRPFPMWNYFYYYLRATVLLLAKITPPPPHPSELPWNTFVTISHCCPWNDYMDGVCARLLENFSSASSYVISPPSVSLSFLSTLSSTTSLLLNFPFGTCKRKWKWNWEDEGRGKAKKNVSD